ncbi:hypothetical protein [Spirosoma pomorum]
MKKPTLNLYDQLKEILLRYPTIRWVSKRNNIVLAREKVEAVNLSFVKVLFRFPLSVFFGATTIDSLRARIELREAMNNSSNVLSWQKLFFLFNEQAPLLLIDEKAQESGYFTRYILVKVGFRFMGIRTNVIRYEAKN